VKPLRIPLLAAVAGAIALAVLFPRLDPSAKFPVSVDRAAAIKRAAEWSAKLGVDPAGWRAQATHFTDDKVNRYRSAFPDDPAARLFTPIAWGVVFSDPAGRGHVRMKVFADGRPSEWTSSTPGAPAVSPTAIAGNFASMFSPDPNAPETAWEWSAGSRYPLVARIEIAQRDGRLLSIAMKPRYERGFDDNGPRDVLRFFFGLFVVVGGVTAVVFFVLAWRHGVIRWRLAAAALVVFAVWGAVVATGGWVRQDLAFDLSRNVTARQPNSSSSGPVGPYASYFAAIAGPWLLLILGGAGYGLARNRYRGKWATIELAARGQAFRRQVSEPVAAGALCGVAIAAIPYAIGRLSGVPLDLTGIEAIGAWVPETSAMRFAVINLVVGFLGLGLPLALRFRARWLRFGLAAIVIVAFAFALGHRFDGVAPALIQGAAAAGICLWLFAEFDLLAVIAAAATAHAVLVPCILLVQPAGSFRDLGVRALFVIGAAIAAALYFAVRGRDVDAADEPLASGLDEGETRARSSRERLEAEFQVARKAQQDALPAIPAAIDGLTFDAVCEPAQQVGGDLYDFFPLPDGRLGVAVADVSGKGVPAALYMMVTKGLISAAARDSGDLRHILQSLNLHLHRACKRKVFVTLAAVAIDPAARRVEYGRAGHNPMVWRRTRRGETLLLKPSGVGLGMCSAEPFARSLRLESLDLEEGDAIVLYSDGVTEAVNPVLDQYGEDRLMRAIETADGGSAAEIRAAIMRDLAVFADGAPARDDITVVAIRAGSWETEVRRQNTE
jgi:hypothetical protein